MKNTVNFHFPNQELFIFYHIQILKCQYHILDERMKKMSELELRKETEDSPDFSLAKTKHALLPPSYETLFPQFILQCHTSMLFHMLLPYT